MSALQTLLETKFYTTMQPGKWLTIYCHMCPEYGTKSFKKKKAGISVDDAGTFRYNCFECNYKAKYDPSKKINKKAKDVLLRLGFTEEQLK